MAGYTAQAVKLRRRSVSIVGVVADRPHAIEVRGPISRVMSDQSQPTDESAPVEQLRTIAFRLRELQRLMSMRVEQENRRLEAEGIDPVTRPRFLQESDAGAPEPPSE